MSAESNTGRGPIRSRFSLSRTFNTLRRTDSTTNSNATDDVAEEPFIPYKPPVRSKVYNICVLGDHGVGKTSLYDSVSWIISIYMTKVDKS
jgi:hypothetical protein